MKNSELFNFVYDILQEKYNDSADKVRGLIDEFEWEDARNICDALVKLEEAMHLIHVCAVAEVAKEIKEIKEGE